MGDNVGITDEDATAHLSTAFHVKDDNNNVIPSSLSIKSDNKMRFLDYSKPVSIIDIARDCTYFRDVGDNEDGLQTLWKLHQPSTLMTKK